ncbi:MAG: peptidylprolyl isomerase [bacterium]
MVVLHTTMGDIKLSLNSEKAPKSVENFLTYVRAGYYDGTIFHRVISSFMIQGGGFTADLKRKETRDPIKNEADNRLKNKRGTIAMARTGAPDSATSQFFINVVDNDMLNYKSKDNGRTWGYAVFGEVIDGMDVVDDIRFVETGAKKPFRQDVPLEPVIITKAEVIEK